MNLVEAKRASASSVARRLGYVAVVPFVLGAALVWLGSAVWSPVAARALPAYAAVVVSFIGAIHWGFAFVQPTPRPGLLVWGVVPSLVAWGALMLDPARGLTLDAAMLVVCYLVDRRVYPQQGAAAWLPLRLQLTLCAALACIVGAAAR